MEPGRGWPWGRRGAEREGPGGAAGLSQSGQRGVQWSRGRALATVGLPPEALTRPGGQRPAREEPTQPGWQTRDKNKSKHIAPNKPASFPREIINKSTETHTGPGLLITRAPLLPLETSL